MLSENRTIVPPVNAAELDPEQPGALCLHARLRLERAWTLHLALEDAHPEDAMSITTAYVYERAVGMPGLNPLSDIRADARFWADWATMAELVEYTAAGLRQLSGQVMGLSIRKLLLATLWRSLPSKEQAAFLRWANGEPD